VSAARFLVFSQDIAPVRIVAVGFGETDGGALLAMRARYLTYRSGSLDVIRIMETGKAGVFEEFLAKRMSVWTHPADERFNVLGYSLSASFLLRAAKRCFTDCAMLAAISPCLWAEPRAADSSAKWLHGKETHKLFLAAGSEEQDAKMTGNALDTVDLVDRLAADLGGIAQD